jgi:hypothetical protein
MSLSLYDITIPVFIRNLKVLDNILAKGEAKDAALAESRLIDDMFPLTFQVQAATNTAKFQPLRTGAGETIVLEDNEKTFPELRARVARVIAFLETIKPDSMNGAEDREVDREIKRTGGPVKLNGKQYTLEFALPNFFFHIGMTYALLRKGGVDVGKGDFLGASL